MLISLRTDLKPSFIIIVRVLMCYSPEGHFHLKTCGLRMEWHNQRNALLMVEFQAFSTGQWGYIALASSEHLTFFSSLFYFLALTCMLETKYVSKKILG